MNASGLHDEFSVRLLAAAAPDDGLRALAKQCNISINGNLAARSHSGLMPAPFL
jgi:hypothetical protein